MRSEKSRLRNRCAACFFLWLFAAQCLDACNQSEKHDESAGFRTGTGRQNRIPIKKAGCVLTAACFLYFGQTHSSSEKRVCAWYHRLKQCELTVRPTHLLCLMNDLSLLQFSHKKRRFGVMQLHISSDILSVVVGIAVTAEMSAGIVSTDIRSENAGTFCSL